MVGCKTRGDGPSATISNEDYKTGQEGITLEFVDNVPPDEIFDNTNFEIGVYVRNDGAYDVDNAKITLTYNDDLMSVEGVEDKKQVTETLNLKGRSRYNPEGELDLVTFEAKTKNKLPTKYNPSSNDMDISVSACYDYESQLIEEVCIDTDRFNINPGAKACEVEDISSSGQGAPVGVTKVKVNMGSFNDESVNDNENKIKPVFYIYVENLGDGVIVDDCKDKYPFAEIKVKAYLSGSRLTCNGNTVTINERNEGSNFIECYLPDGISKDFMSFKTTLSVELDYKYRTNTLTKTINWLDKYNMP